MSITTEAWLVVACFAAGVIGAAATIRRSITIASPRLMRTNVSGRAVPAVLAGPLSLGMGAAAVLISSFGGDLAHEAQRIVVAVGMAASIMAAAGLYDDLRGDEKSRGFKGHLKEAAALRLSGGLVKMAAGAVAGLIAGFVIAGGREATEIALVVEVALLVALASNLVNLLDRAPGRASKVVLLAALPLVLFGHPGWTLGAAGLLGALLVCTPVDLAEQAMLGDAGANALGALVGVGIAVGVGERGRLIAIAILLAANLASERWSFSRLIESTPPLRALDRWGRS